MVEFPDHSADGQANAPTEESPVNQQSTKSQLTFGRVARRAHSSTRAKDDDGYLKMLCEKDLDLIELKLIADMCFLFLPARLSSITFAFATETYDVCPTTPEIPHF